MESWGITDKGKVRKQNQDAFYISKDDTGLPQLFAVCDGMGGAKAGNVASELAVTVFRTECPKMMTVGMTAADAAEAMKAVSALANTAVYELSRANPDCSGMGTTLVAAALCGDELAVINIGDSRAYRIEKEDMRLITRDHSLVEDMIERGDITREESRNHPNKNLITRAVGTVPQVLCDTFVVALNDGDYVLLCSDGLTNVVAEWEIQYEVLHAGSVQKSCENLINLALERGAPDNVTVVIFRK